MERKIHTVFAKLRRSECSRLFQQIRGGVIWPNRNAYIKNSWGRDCVDFDGKCVTQPAYSAKELLIYRLLAGRFALDSPHHLLLRMLARSAMRRMRRLEDLLHELSGTATSGLPRRWLFAWKYWYARQAPRKWTLLQFTHQKE